MTICIFLVRRLLFPRPRWERIAVVIFLLGIPMSAKAQTPVGSFSRTPLRPPYEEQRIPGSRRSLPPVSLPRRLTREEKARLAETRRVALNLAERSDDSFRRGLMPLGDYLRQLSLSYRLRQSVAKLEVGESRQSVNHQEVARYREIVHQLEKFQQPAAAGWAADLALARSHLAQLEAEQAYFQGDEGSLLSALNRQVAWASRHVALRKWDEALGLASPREVLSAKQFQRRAQLDSLSRYPTVEEYRAAYQAYRNDLAQFAGQVERWSEQGAGIGRADRLHRVRYELAQADTVLGILHEDSAAQTRALKTAERELSALLETQTAFIRQGTGSFFDLARTWSDRQNLYDQADLTDFPGQESLAAHAQDFEMFKSWANQVQDRRGRIAADLEFVAALQQERELAALRKKMADPFREAGR